MNEYIVRLEAIINSHAIVASYNLKIDRKMSEVVFISGKIEFRDGSFLDFKEFLESIEGCIEKYKYAYNCRRDPETYFLSDDDDFYHFILKDDIFHTQLILFLDMIVYCFQWRGKL